MRRRTLLVTTGTALTAASGCTTAPSGDGGGDDDGNGNYTRVRNREGEVEDDDIVLDSADVSEPDPTEDGDPVLMGVVRNEGDVLAENIEGRVEFYDSDGEVLFDRAVSIGNIGPGSIERIMLSFPPDVTADDVENYDFSWSKSANGETDTH